MFSCCGSRQLPSFIFTPNSVYTDSQQPLVAHHWAQPRKTSIEMESQTIQINIHSSTETKWKCDCFLPGHRPAQAHCGVVTLEKIELRILVTMYPQKGLSKETQVGFRNAVSTERSSGIYQDSFAEPKNAIWKSLLSGCDDTLENRYQQSYWSMRRSLRLLETHRWIVKRCGSAPEAASTARQREPEVRVPKT